MVRPLRAAILYPSKTLQKHQDLRAPLSQAKSAGAEDQTVDDTPISSDCSTADRILAAQIRAEA
jgi:hypothetical protein